MIHPFLSKFECPTSTGDYDDASTTYNDPSHQPPAPASTTMAAAMEDPSCQPVPAPNSSPLSPPAVMPVTAGYSSEDDDFIPIHALSRNKVATPQEPIRFPNPKTTRNCDMCKKNKIKTKNGRAPQTNWKCRFCEAGVHRRCYQLHLITQHNK